MSEFQRLASDPLAIFAVVGAVLFKIASDAKITIRNAVVTIIAAGFSAYIFGFAIVEYYQISKTFMIAAILATAALTGEHLMRLVIGLSQDPKKAIELWHALRSGGKNADK